MKVYVLTKESVVIGVFKNLDDAKHQVHGGYWDYTGTHNLTPFGWFNGNHRIDGYELLGGE